MRAPNHLIKDLSFEEKLHYLRLSRTENVGPVGFFHLLNRFKTPQEALLRLPEQGRFRGKIPPLEDAQREFAAHEKNGYHLICYFDPLYPPLLRQLKDPPPFISVQGDLRLLHRTGFAMVGGRNASQSAETFVRKIVPDLKKCDGIIVSGLARGVDTWSHKAALEAQMPTIAVIAGGLGNIYPQENKSLYQEIAQKGVIISEDRLSCLPQAELFPKRNRLISGLSWGVLIVEAGLKSGSLLTAKYAADQGRTVFVVPGHPLDPRSKGGNRLLKEGACLVDTAEDIIQAYQETRNVSSLKAREEVWGEEEQAFYLDTDPLPWKQHEDRKEEIFTQIRQALSDVPVIIDQLASHLNVPSLFLRTLLIELELDGVIQRYPGDAVVLNFSGGTL